MQKRILPGLLVAALAMARAGPQETGRGALEHYRSASRLYLEGKYGQAVEELTVSLRLEPRQLRATNLLGISYQLLGRLPEAEDTFRRATRLDEKDFDAWFYLGRVCYEQNFFDRALTALKRALLLKPADLRAREYLALTLEAAGDTEGALREYGSGLREASRQGKPSWTLHLTYGVLLHKLNRLPESEAQLQRARELNPRHWQAWFELGKLHIETGAPSAAAGELLEALKTGTATAEETARIYRLLARAYYALGRDDDAREALATAAKSGP